eukprot:gene4006-14086_t
MSLEEVLLECLEKDMESMNLTKKAEIMAAVQQVVGMQPGQGKKELKRPVSVHLGLAEEEQLSGEETIMVTSFNVSCSSDRLRSDRDMVGMVVYSYKGQTEWQLNGEKCKAGYILIKDTAGVQHVTSKYGQSLWNDDKQVHGALFKWFFNMERSDDFVASGFSIRNGKFTFRSGVLNRYPEREMGPLEQHYIETAIRRRFAPGAGHESKIMRVSDMRKALFVIPSPRGSSLCSSVSDDSDDSDCTHDDSLDLLYALLDQAQKKKKEGLIPPNFKPTFVHKK